MYMFVLFKIKMIKITKWNDFGRKNLKMS